MSSPAAGRVSAVIVHYRTPAETVAAARAVADTARGTEIVVVDNASGDSIGPRLAAEVPAARLLVETENRGYGAACNRGARETSRPLLLLLNSDAFVGAGAVESLAAALEADPGAAAVGPRLENPDGSLQPSIQRLPSLRRIFFESSGLAHLSGDRGPFRGHSATRENHSFARPVESLRGAALLVRRTAFEQAGGFDETFFLYAEETDLMARWRRLGWRLLFEPSARVVHRGGASGGDALFRQLHEGLVRHVARHQGATAARLARIFLRAGAAARYMLSLVTPGERGRTRRARYRAALAGARRA
jgi:N-acetylglucosaminyl-diphospho-decaprenol L-rhamnosyltransferase